MPEDFYFQDSIKRRNPMIEGTNQIKATTVKNFHHENACGFPGGDRGGTSDAPLLSCKYRK